MYNTLRKHLQKYLSDLSSQGLYKKERVIISPQGPEIQLLGEKPVLNFCANNYLGLSSHPRIQEAVTRALHTYGFGLSSVRFICGTQDIHKNLERRLSEFLGTEDTILYASAFDANGGLFEPLFEEEDAIISDTLNHASIIDGIRLCKAKRHRYLHNNMTSLEEVLKKTQQARHRVIVTDGVFSMDGTIAQLDNICSLARKYKALTVIDECHATGFIGNKGRGTHELYRVIEQIDIITGTLGKALGGANGGFTSGRKEIIDVLRQISRPYLFSNSVAPSVVAAAIESLNIISESNILREKLFKNTAYFREKIQKVGYTIVQGEHPIVPIMLYDSLLAEKLAEKLLDRGIYLISFSYPVVPKGQARIRVQISASHTQEHLDKLLLALEKEGMSLGVI